MDLFYLLKGETIGLLGRIVYAGNSTFAFKRYLVTFLKISMLKLFSNVIIGQFLVLNIY